MAFFRRPTAPTDDEVLRGLMKGGTAPSATAPQAEMAPEKEMPKVTEPAAAPSPSGGFDGSGYGTASGYLQAATKWLQPQVQAAKSEQEAKSLVQNYLQSIAPELEKRGARVGKIKNEAITLDGREYDTFRDIGGASEAQMMELGLPGGNAPAAMGAMGTMAGMLPGTGGSLLQSLVPTDQTTYQKLLQRMQELNGPEAVDREALLALMAR